MSEQKTKPALKDRVSEKMGMAAWMHELYYQNASMFMSDSRWKQLPPYLQTSGVSSTFIALKAALDKIRETVDLMLNFEKDLKGRSTMELTKISWKGE